MNFLLSVTSFISYWLCDNHIAIRHDNYIMRMTHSESTIDDYLDEHNASITEMAKRYRRMDHPYQGYDRHAPEDDPIESAKLMKELVENNEKMRVLRTLENTDFSIHVRKLLVEDYTRNHSESPLLVNLSAGGLWEDWNFEM